jgi:protocatechuate 3,4-dioxygenase beta subunit
MKTVPAVLLAAIWLLAANFAAGGTFPKTPADYEGPFYPVTQQQDIDNDLVHVKGRDGIATGDILNLSGVVIDTDGVEQKGVTIEIWQTDPEGRYRHPGDSSPGERDPNFQYWGSTTTGTDGTYFFKTVIPGAYHPRPAHIHYKVYKDGKRILTSQIYFTRPAKDGLSPSMTGKTELQTVELKPAGNGEFKAFFRIVI